MQLEPNGPTMGLSRGTLDVLRERVRQVSVEGWASADDDRHRNREMLQAALVYAQHAATDEVIRRYTRPSGWPWANSWWKPTTPRRDLVKAIALLLAELDRMDRADEPASAPADIVSENMDRTYDRITARQVFAAARAMAAPKHRGLPNWSFTMELLSLGSTYAWEACARMGIDPDAKTATRWPETGR
ncbi:hypothetical protein ACLNGM_09875 [Aureimonas phyllosphaerae]|uniref:hypothetical protein n=1 Tax=Aureimonas phyllosphaerae TaxID=1166078 RepID=UPI003A5BE763